jgi:hypothetical protein
VQVLLNKYIFIDVSNAILMQKMSMNTYFHSLISNCCVSKPMMPVRIKEKVDLKSRNLQKKTIITGPIQNFPELKSIENLVIQLRRDYPSLSFFSFFS